MYDSALVNKRYFKVEQKYTNAKGENKTLRLEVEPPKLKVLRRISGLMEQKESDIPDIIWALSTALSKNKTRYVVSETLIEDAFDIDEMIALLNLYFNWVQEATGDPN